MPRRIMNRYLNNRQVGPQDLSLACEISHQVHPPAAIRYDLGDSHTYDFVNGTVAWQADPGKPDRNYTSWTG